MSHQNRWIFVLSVLSACGGRSPGLYEDATTADSCSVDGEGGADSAWSGGMKSLGGATSNNIGGGATTSLGGATTSLGGAATSLGGAATSLGGTTSNSIGGGAATSLGGAATSLGGTTSNSIGGGAATSLGGAATSLGGAATSLGGTTSNNIGGGAATSLGGAATSLGGAATSLGGAATSLGGAATSLGGATSNNIGGGASASLGGAATSLGGAATSLGGAATSLGGTTSNNIGGGAAIGGTSSAGGQSAAGGKVTGGSSSTGSVGSTGATTSSGGSPAGGTGTTGGAIAIGGSASGAAGSISTSAGTAAGGSSGGAGPWVGCRCGEANCGTCPTTPVVSRIGYRIDATETTNAEYAAFLEVNPLIEAQPDVCSWNWTYIPSGDWPATGRANQPVTWVDWCDAYAYCNWAGKRLCGARAGGAAAYTSNDDVSQNEWFAACTDEGAHAYPYGNVFDPSACNGADYGLGVWVDTGSLSSCQVAGLGIYDMSGNVYEWENSCATWQGGQDICHARGGSFYTEDPGLLRCRTATNIYSRSATRKSIGFRCCDDV